ncbi:phosphoribosyltransferase [Nocardia sp. CA-128927]|uniref:phosphoribosyltransferase n=1 Tax=Nocardia sp. CA-128927 TaxID=3239975 RepID=UPI003D963F78
MPFLDRRDAGRRLAERLRSFRSLPVVVLGLPCGGIPVAYEIATVLKAPVDVACVRALSVPYQPPLVFGALAEDGIEALDEEIIARALISEPERIAVTREQRQQLRHTITRFRREHAPVPLEGVTAVIVVDGLDTAVTARAGVAAARARGAARVVLAVPVAAARVVRVMAGIADHVICLETPRLFGSIRLWYRDFSDVTDVEGCALLGRAAPAFAVDPDTHIDVFSSSPVRPG